MHIFKAKDNSLKLSTVDFIEYQFKIKKII